MGTDLDFKAQQYKFSKVSDADKGELIKHILAMANSWRDGTSYILVGVEDRWQDTAADLGNAETLDDTDLQHFIQGKRRCSRTGSGELPFKGAR